MSDILVEVRFQIWCNLIAHISFVRFGIQVDPSNEWAVLALEQKPFEVPAIKKLLETIPLERMTVSKQGPDQNFLPATDQDRNRIIAKLNDPHPKNQPSIWLASETVRVD